MNDMIQAASTAAGWGGAVATVLAFGMVSRGRLAADSLTYQALNLVGAVLLGTSAAASGAWPSLAVNVVWLAIAGLTLVNVKTVLARWRGRRREAAVEQDIAAWTQELVAADDLVTCDR